MIVTYELKINPQPRKPLTPDEIAAIEARAPRDEDIVYDKDCPPMTDEQLRQFQRVYPRPERIGADRKFG